MECKLIIIDRSDGELFVRSVLDKVLCDEAEDCDLNLDDNGLIC